MRTLAQHADHDRLGGVGALGTALLHSALVLLIVLGRQSVRRSPLPAYSVQLVAAPRAAVEADQTTAGEETRTAARPAPTRAEARARQLPALKGGPSGPVAAERGPRSASAAAPSAGPSVRPSAQPAAPPAPGPSVAPAAASPNSNAAPGTGTGPANIRTEGVEFPFPGYLRNLVSQVYRRWHPPSNNADLEAEMLFFVHRDGSVTGLQFVRRSGAFAFDLEAQGAVEAAARAGTFGSLPQGFGPDVLPVSFFFSPRSLR